MCFKFYFMVLFICCNGVELVKVKVEQGWLEGQVLVPSTGMGQYYSFKGIPYAAPPVGKLRFRAPQPPLKWKGTRNASEHGSICVQQSSLTSRDIVGGEDCLFLNVYTPKLNPPALFPVMFFIHGGGFITGSGNDDEYSPDFLVGFSVILVTINYRLGALGFLNAGFRDALGNAGLKDQIAAMQWVQRNIRNFGGDPKRVTIFGHSAGGSSVSLHVISPAAKGLFQRAISMSGVFYNDWALNFNPERSAYTLGRILGIDTNDPIELISYLRNLPADSLNKARPNTAFSNEASNDLMILNYFTPSVEKKFNNGDGQYLTERADVLACRRQINHVDLMIGHTAKEGLRTTALIENIILKYYPYYKQFLVPRKIANYRSFNNILELADRIQRFYFGNQSISIKTINNFVEFETYFLYEYDIHAYNEKLPQLPGTKRFFYEFSIYSSRNVYSKPGAMRYGIQKATHRDDLPYLFDGPAFNLTLDVNSVEFKYVQRTCTLFTNFAKYGTPTPDDSLGLIWPEYNPGRAAVIIGESGNLTASSVPYNTNTSIGFWHQLYKSTGINY